MPALNVEVLRADAAHALLAEAPFRAAWRRLCDACPHATAFQSPGFAGSWYRVYRSRWQPVIVRATDAGGELCGLWLLAQDGAGRLVHAGAHQAEYQGWLAAPGRDAGFLQAAWPRLLQAAEFEVLRLRYLPAAAPAALLQSLPGLAGRVAIRRHRRPLLALDPAELKASLAKKGNRSRLNRLARLGSIEFRRLGSRAELEPLIDELIACYDLRQGAVNGVTPFAEDALKREFHCELLASAPGDTCVTATLLDGRPVAAFWGALSGAQAHLGMLIHSPLLAQHSPGKLHLMALGEHLLRQGVDTLDLTPGGDPWKERFCNRHDEVAEVRLYRSPVARQRDAALDAMRRGAKRALVRLGFEPARLRDGLAAAGGQAARLLGAAGRQREGATSLHLGRPAGAPPPCRDPRVRCGSLAELLAFAADGPGRDAFLSAALARLERGEKAYTIRARADERPAMCAWTASKADGAGEGAGLACHGLAARPGAGSAALAAALLGHILCEAGDAAVGQGVRVVLPQGEACWRQALQALGLEEAGAPRDGPEGAGSKPGAGARAAALEVRDA